MNQQSSTNLDSLSAHERAIREQIAQLQEFLLHGPERERQAMEEQMQTLPPPSDLVGRQREREFMEKLSRGELKNQRRRQATSGLLLALLILAIATLGLWIYNTLQ